ncbi:MAG: OmpH family outer membrane protein [Holosporales bacterium]|jgi:Skp family chaperone for outer membrane proteins|nr:OmpH family outer membrane protein [Holosporales bacterium]
MKLFEITLRTGNFGRRIALASVIFVILMSSVFLLDHFKRSTPLPLSSKKKSDQDPCGPGIGIIDGKRLKEAATCFQSHDKLAEMLSEILSKIRESETKIKEEYEKVKDDPHLSQKQKLKDIAKIEAKWSDISAKYNSEIQVIKNTDLKLSEYIQAKLSNVIKSIAKSMKLSVVLSKGTKDALLVFYSANGLDITELIVQKMNEILPEVVLKELIDHG